MNEMTMAAVGGEGMRGLAQGAIRQALGLDTSDLRIGLDAAEAQIRAGDFTGALSVYIGLVLCDPLQLDFQIGLANCALLVGEPALALQAASAAVMVAPDDARAYILSGRACLELEAYKEAVEDLTAGIERAAASGHGDLLRPAQAMLDLAARKAAAPAP